MNMPKLSVITSLLFIAMTLTGCGSIQSAAEDDCSSIGWMPGTAGYERCVKDRIYERKLDYSLPPGDQPSPSLI
jgi:hypothetical protein